MAIDTEKHEADIMATLRRVYEAVKADAESRGRGDYKSFLVQEDNLVDMDRYTKAQAEKIIDDLRRCGYLKIMSRSSYALTDAGIDTAEQSIYEQSSLGRWRWLKSFLIGTALRKVASIIGAILLALVIFALTTTDLPLWVKWVFGFEG